MIRPLMGPFPWPRLLLWTRTSWRLWGKQVFAMLNPKLPRHLWQQRSLPPFKRGWTNWRKWQGRSQMLQHLVERTSWIRPLGPILKDNVCCQPLQLCPLDGSCVQTNHLIWWGIRMLEKIVNINLLSSQLDTLNDLYSRGLLEGSSEKFLSCASGCQHCPVHTTPPQRTLDEGDHAQRQEVASPWAEFFQLKLVAPITSLTNSRVSMPKVCG